MNSPFKGLVITRRDGPDLGINVGDVVSAIVRDVKKESDQIILILVRARNPEAEQAKRLPA